MKRVIRITETDLFNIVKRVINEQTIGNINPKNLKFGNGGKKNPSQVDDVKQLQQKLIDLGYLKITKPTGYFGNLTNSALTCYSSGKKPSECQTQTPIISSPIISTPKTTEPVSKDYLAFDGNSLKYISNGKVVKSWSAASGK